MQPFHVFPLSADTQKSSTSAVETLCPICLLLEAKTVSLVITDHSLICLAQVHSSRTGKSLNTRSTPAPAELTPCSGRFQGGTEGTITSKCALSPQSLPKKTELIRFLCAQQQFKTCYDDSLSEIQLSRSKP